MHVSIDFTLTNGNPFTKHSLHYNKKQKQSDFSNEKKNEYVRALRTANNVLLYDSDKRIPVYGFGAGIGKGCEISHCFAINGNIFDPEIIGLDNVFQSYGKAIFNTNFNGPTIYGQVLERINDQCEY